MQNISLQIGATHLDAFELGAILAILGFLTLFWIALSLRKLKNKAFEDEGALLEQTRDLENQLQNMNQLHADLNGRLSAVAEMFGSQQSELNKNLMGRLDTLMHRVGQGLEAQTQNTQQTLSQLGERLALIDGAQENIKNLAQEMSSLKDILSNKQTRGAFGQAQLEALLRDGLPVGSYEFQATLSNSKRPDALIFLPNDTRPLVVDAKFPLESFTQLREATNDGERKSAGQRVRADIHKHVQDISEKYLVAGQTQDIALMFVPSEGLYADLYEHFDDVIQKAYRSKVMIVSPSLLMLSIQMMRAQIRDAKMREQVHVLQAELGELVKDVVRLGERAKKLESHFTQAQDDVSNILISTDKITRRGGKIEDMEFAPKAIATAVEQKQSA